MARTSRRRFLAAGAALATVAGQRGLAAAALATDTVWQAPAEWAPHRCTWMAFGANQTRWEGRLDQVRAELTRIAKALLPYEPVRMLVGLNDRQRCALRFGSTVTLVDCDHDDLAIRDSGPVFVRSEHGEPGSLSLNFNGWGGLQDHGADAGVAGWLGVVANTVRCRTGIVGEGGAISVDGEGTALVSEASFVDERRNPGVSRATIDSELRRQLGLQKIVWLPGGRSREPGGGHAEFHARFARPGVVVASLPMDPSDADYTVTRALIDALPDATDARGRKLRVILLPTPARVRASFNRLGFKASYASYYVANGVVLAPEYGDARSDALCRDALAQLYPERRIVQLPVDALSAGGSSIHNVTLQQPVI